MTKLAWGEAGNRTFELGVDRGVFYPTFGVGEAWNGLIAINESPEGGEVESFYLDGIKYLGIQGSEDFAGPIEAFGYPPGFLAYDGSANVSGLVISHQPRKTFGFSYRTLVGNDTEGLAYYKLHLVYNVLVAPSERAYKTAGESSEPLTFSWDFTTTPELMTGYRPTSHLILDSRYVVPATLAAIEDSLYGTMLINSSLPSATAIIDLIES